MTTSSTPPQKISRETDLSDMEYRWGFVTDVESDIAPKGLNEDIVRFISAKKNEPEWLLEWRLKAYKHWLKLEAEDAEPTWAKVEYPKIDYQNMYYYSAPKKPEDGPQSMDEVDPELLEAFDKLGVPLHERSKLAGVAVDAVFDSVSVATTFADKLEELGIIFCSFNEAVQNHPDLVKKYLGSVVPYTDNFLRHTQLRRVQRRLVRLCPGGCEVPDRADDLFPHKHGGFGSVREDSDRG